MENLKDGTTRQSVTDNIEASLQANAKGTRLYTSATMKDTSSLCGKLWHGLWRRCCCVPTLERL